MNINIVLSLFSGLSAIVSIIGGFLSLKHNQFKAVDEFLTKIESTEFIEAKNHVYNSETFDITDQKAAIIVNFFHHWGLLTKKRYLPLWVFKGATGQGANRLYKRLSNYINRRRKLNNDPSYGEYFEWLIKSLQKHGYIS